MNILVVGKFHTESFALHISETLLDMKHSVTRFEPGSKGRHITNKRFFYLKKIRNKAFRLIADNRAVRARKFVGFQKHLTKNIDLSIVTHDFLYSEQVDIIKQKTKAPVVLWHPDTIANCGKYMFMNADYDALFFKDPYIVQVFKNEYGKNTFYLPECCNPKKHFKVALTDEDKKYFGCVITTAGNMHANRQAFFSNLTDYNIKIWGPPVPLWMNLGPVKKMVMNKTVFNEEKSKAFLAAKIVLNNLHPTEIWGINVRAFEIAGSGGFQLINWRPGLDQLFEDGKELVSFANYKDLIEKIDNYLMDEESRKRIADAGYKRAKKDHTYELRLKLLIDTIFNTKYGYELSDIHWKGML